MVDLVTNKTATCRSSELCGTYHRSLAVRLPVRAAGAPCRVHQRSSSTPARRGKDARRSHSPGSGTGEGARRRPRPPYWSRVDGREMAQPLARQHRRPVRAWEHARWVPRRSPGSPRARCRGAPA